SGPLLTREEPVDQQIQSVCNFDNERISMPTTLPMAQRQSRAAFYSARNSSSYFSSPISGVRDELHRVFSSDQFSAVAIFSGIGLLVSLIAIASGVQGVWI